MPVGRRKGSLLQRPLYQHRWIFLGLVLHSIIVSALAQYSGRSGSGFLGIDGSSDGSGEEVHGSASGDFGMHECIVNSPLLVV